VIKAGISGNGKPIYPQDKNAGNLGDVLKHFWLLRLLERSLDLEKVYEKVKNE